ncbi:MAG: SpoIIIAH-like family protein [Clostridia bacterium]|nr:SpoIIIAH-like family protein [Clostridia bacterium]
MDTQLELKKEPRSFPKIGRRSIAVVCAVLLIAAAVVLNLVLFRGQDTVDDPATDSGGDVSDGAGDTLTGEDGYFSATQVSRQRARDEALEVLQGVVDSEAADEATKTGALLEISELAKAMEAEANIETLVVAKGFAQCVAVINGDTCSVVVSCEGELQPAQISQINEIVYEQAGIAPANIRIVTK